MNELDRRKFLIFAGSGAATLGLAACAGPAGSSTTEGAVTEIRYGWWGNTTRQQAYMEAFKVFEEENPDVKIVPQFADYGPFQERLTTQMAARDVPEVFWIASPQVLTYYTNGIYHNLEGIDSIDLSDYSPEQIESFKIDGQLNTMPHTASTTVMRYNETFLEESGMELPANEPGSWTWEALSEFLIDYTNNNGAGRKGIANGANYDLMFEEWLRQHGEDLWTKDGDIGFTVDGLAGWLSWWQNLTDAGAALTLSEQAGPSMDWAVAGANTLMAASASNHIVDAAQQFPDYNFELRLTPTVVDPVPDHRLIYYSRIAMYANTPEDKVEAAGKVLNFDINHPAMITPTLSLGAPVNKRQLAAAYDVASETQAKMLAIMEEVNVEGSRPRYEAPAGTSTWRNTFDRTVETVSLERASIEEASQAMIDEIRKGIANAS